MSDKIYKKVCLAGKNDIAVYGLSLLLNYLMKENLFVVCNESDDGFDGWQPSLRKYSNEIGIEEISLQQCYNIDELIFISLEFDKIISPEKFSNARLYNIHFSKLPAYKGMYTSALPLLNCEKETGVTLHRIDSGIDTGDIIDQIVFPIEDADTAKDLYLNYLNFAKQLLNSNILRILNGLVTAEP
jgi:methionyl-tRNA formyltransferase